MIGCGSIGRGFLPLLDRHITFDRNNLHVIDPSRDFLKLNDQWTAHYQDTALTPENYEAVLNAIFQDQPGGFCINLSVDTGSLDILKHCRKLGVLYIDTVVEPWLGYHAKHKDNPRMQTNYALRQAVRDEKEANPGGPTAVSCCGANPGMVSWFVKEALLRLAADLKHTDKVPKEREDWAVLMKDLGVKGVHIAERDTQIANSPKKPDEFVNTWSVDGFLSEGFQPAELGWGTHETWMPENAHQHDSGCQAAIYLDRPGGNTRVYTWCPTRGSQFGFLVTHNESITISDYFTIGSGANPEYRPTCHYAYHPADDAVLSLHECFGTKTIQSSFRIMEEDDIISGIDELGVLLYGHKKNAYWFGSQLSIDETRELAPFQNATGLQVTSAVLAGVVWALENPEAGIVEAEEMDHQRCLEIQLPYLGPVEGYYTDWTPLQNQMEASRSKRVSDDPWQFSNVLAE